MFATAQQDYFHLMLWPVRASQDKILPCKFIFDMHFRNDHADIASQGSRDGLDIETFPHLGITRQIINIQKIKKIKIHIPIIK